MVDEGSAARATSAIAFTAQERLLNGDVFSPQTYHPSLLNSLYSRIYNTATSWSAKSRWGVRRPIQAVIATRPDDFHALAFDMMAIYMMAIYGGAIHMASPVVRFRIDFAEHSSIGPGKISLLEAVRDSGSLSQGARNIGMSYRRAWLLMESLRRCFREPVTVASTGGKDGGGMHVTEFGDALIKSYRQLERDLAALAARNFHAIIPTVIRHSKAGARTSIRTRL
jgi:molybdate transport system regulatory protein